MMMFSFLKDFLSILFQLVAIPIKKWYHLCIKGEYLIDDDHTEKFIAFLTKIAQDPKYQPTEDEQEFEQDLIEGHYQIIEEDPELTEENYRYEDQRQRYAIEGLRFIQEYARIKEDE